MKSKIFGGLSLLPILVTLIAFKFMPQEIPTHYNLSGEIDRWGSRYEYLILPVATIFLAIFFYIISRYFVIIQKKSTKEKEIIETKQNEKILYWVGIGLIIVFNVIQLILLYNAATAVKGVTTKWEFNLFTGIYIILSLLLIIIGNIIPKAKLNGIVGMRTKWSMNNDITWLKSNRFCGRLFVIVGILNLLMLLILKGILVICIFLASLVMIAIIAIMYSYRVYLKYGTK